MSIGLTDQLLIKRSANHYRALVSDLPRLAIPATRAVLNSAASASGLVVDTIYWISDEQRLAIGTAANAYTAMAKQSEVGGLIDGDKGDITVSGTGTVLSIDADAQLGKTLAMRNSLFLF